MTVSLLASADLEEVSRLTIEVFDGHVAPLYPPDGRGEFLKYVDPLFLTERIGAGMRIWVARDNGALTGIIALKDPSHISLFFVRTEQQGKGIGRLLFDRAAAEAAEEGVETLSVNASPNAVGIYTALGFQPDGGPKTLNGITSHPMNRSLEDYRAARRGEITADDTLLPGPSRFLVCGFTAEERDQLSAFLSGLLDTDLELRAPALPDLEGSLGHLLERDQSADPLPAEKLPRVLLVSGVRYSDLRLVMEHWSGTGLHRPIFAATTARNLHFPVRELLGHLLEERRRQTG